jgi:hypothetical protein
MKKALVFGIGFLGAAVGYGIALAQAPAKPPMAMVSIYHLAPGKQLDFLKWIAKRDAVAKEAGAPTGKIYAHMDGDSWDFMVINEINEDPALDAKVEALEKKKGLTTGFAAGLELRQLMTSHTDTKCAGPFTADELVKEATKK